jgi:hypothetical protein
MTDLVNPLTLLNNVSSIGTYQAGVDINKAHAPIIIEMADADLTLTEDQHGYSAYIFVTTNLTAGRDVIFNPDYFAQAAMIMANSGGTETIGIKFDGGSAMSITDGLVISVVADPSILYFGQVS